MANIDGSVRSGVSDVPRASNNSAGFPFTGSVRINATIVGDSPPSYKNQGYYVAGGVQEAWISVGNPTTFPPSGHSLIEIGHQLVRA